MPRPKRERISLGEWILELIFPTRCLICRKIIPREKNLICPDCRSHLVYATPRSTESGHLYRRCVAPFLYQEPLRQAFLRYKFNGREFEGETFGLYLAQSVEEELAGTFDLITWVPLSTARLVRRGYDQTQRMAQVVADRQQMPLTPTLQKIRRTRVQSSIRSDDERRRNVAGAYRLRSGAEVSGQRVLLIDDICTTGSTLDSCAQVLFHAGAAEVVCAVLARRPNDS